MPRRSMHGDATAAETRQRIGPAIRQLRQQHHLSLTELAEQTGISVSYLSRLEKGLSVPSFTLLSALSENLGVPIDFFVQTEHEAQSVDAKLAAALRHAGIAEGTAHELFGLSLGARKELLTYFQGQGGGPQEDASDLSAASQPTRRRKAVGAPS